MIDQGGRPRIGGPGLHTISDSTLAAASSSSKAHGTTRWMSPERLDPNWFGFLDGRATEESDCYALGMVILEVLTGQAPFPSYNDSTVAMKILDGERPERPQGAEAVWFTDDLWEMMRGCWSPQPKFRPTAEIILENLERGSAAWKLLSPAEQADNDNIQPPAEQEGDGGNRRCVLQ